MASPTWHSVEKSAVIITLKRNNWEPGFFCFAPATALVFITQPGDQGMKRPCFAMLTTSTSPDRALILLFKLSHYAPQYVKLGGHRRVWYYGLEIRDAWMDSGSEGYVSSHLRRFDMKPGKMLNAPILLFFSVILKKIGCLFWNLNVSAQLFPSFGSDSQKNVFC